MFNFLFDPLIAHAADAYIPLAPIGKFITDSTVANYSQSLGAYINGLFTLGVAAAGFLAVIMIVVGGIQYIGSDVVTSKAEAKGRIQNAVLGLVLALSTFLILKTINADFLNTNLDIRPQTIDVDRQRDPAVIPNFEGGGANNGAFAGIADPSRSNPSNPVVYSGYNETGAYVTTYANGTSQAFYTDAGGIQHLAQYSASGQQIGDVRDVSSVAYSGRPDANGNYAPTAFYYSDGGVSYLGNGAPPSVSNPQGLGNQALADSLANLYANQGGRLAPGGYCAMGVSNALEGLGIPNVPRANATNQSVNFDNLVNTAGSGWSSVTVSSPGEAPVGSVLIYSDSGGSRGGGAQFGHIEVVGADGRYYSDKPRNNAGGSVAGNFTGVAYIYSGPITPRR